MKVSNSKKGVKMWEGSNSEFRLFYLSGELLKLLDDLASESDQAELIYGLVKEEHERRFGGSNGS